jgi:hypothetical protein
MRFGQLLHIMKNKMCYFECHALNIKNEVNLKKVDEMLKRFI